MHPFQQTSTYIQFSTYVLQGILQHCRIDVWWGHPCIIPALSCSCSLFLFFFLVFDADKNKTTGTILVSKLVSSVLIQKIESKFLQISLYLIILSGFWAQQKNHRSSCSIFLHHWWMLSMTGTFHFCQPAQVRWLILLLRSCCYRSFVDVLSCRGNESKLLVVFLQLHCLLIWWLFQQICMFIWL